MKVGADIDRHVGPRTHVVIEARAIGPRILRTLIHLEVQSAAVGVDDRTFCRGERAPVRCVCPDAHRTSADLAKPSEASGGDDRLEFVVEAEVRASAVDVTGDEECFVAPGERESQSGNGAVDFGRNGIRLVSNRDVRRRLVLDRADDPVDVEERQEPHVSFQIQVVDVGVRRELRELGNGLRRRAVAADANLLDVDVPNQLVVDEADTERRRQLDAALPRLIAEKRQTVVRNNREGC